MGEAVGPDLHNEIRDLLEPLWSTGLSATLDTCLRTLAVSVPQLKREISEGYNSTEQFFKMLCMILHFSKSCGLMGHFLCRFASHAVPSSDAQTDPSPWDASSFVW